MPVFVLTLCGNFRNVDTDELARRLRTARAYGGFRSVEAVAEAINQKGLGVKTLRNIESGTRTAQKRDIQAIAEVCGLPPEFFTAADPFAGQPADLDAQLAVLEQKLEDNHQMLAMILTKLGVKNAEEAESLRLPAFSKGLRELLRPQADTPRPAREDTA